MPLSVRARRSAAARCQRLLAGVPGLGQVTVRPDRNSVFAQFTVFVDQRAALQAAAVPTAVPTAVPIAVHYPKPLHHQAACAAFCCPDGCPLSVLAGPQVMSLPVSAVLTQADQDRVVAVQAETLEAWLTAVGDAVQ